MENSGNEGVGRLYVGNLPYGITPEELSELFAQAGAVESVYIPVERETNRPRGFGFVQMGDEAAMKQAIETFNGYTLDGRELVVNQARPRENRQGGGGRPFRQF